MEHGNVVNRMVLQRMRLEELWELFPVELVPHRAEWGVWAEEEMQRLEVILAAYSPVVTHVGSTAVPGICAKPIVDILVEVADYDVFGEVMHLLESADYICMSQSRVRMSFNKGYTPVGYAQRVFHVHVRGAGDNAEIGFRDYLLAHRDCAEAYEKLKQSLLPRYRNDRDGYTAAKSSFVERINGLSRSK